MTEPESSPEGAAQLTWQELNAFFPHRRIVGRERGRIGQQHGSKQSSDSHGSSPILLLIESFRLF